MNFGTSIQAFVALVDGSAVLQILCQYHLPYPNPKRRIAPKREEYSQSINKLGFVASLQVVVHSGGALAVVSIPAWERRRASEMQERSRGVGVKDTTPHSGLSQVSAGRTGARTRRRSQTGCGTVLASTSGRVRTDETTQMIWRGTRTELVR